VWLSLSDDVKGPGFQGLSIVDANGRFAPKAGPLLLTENRYVVCRGAQPHATEERLGV